MGSAGALAAMPNTTNAIRVKATVIFFFKNIIVMVLTLEWE